MEAGDIAGVVGKNLAAEGMQIKLEGQLAQCYHISYRVKLVGRGWSAWSRDGKTAGKPGKGIALEAVQIKVTPY